MHPPHVLREEVLAVEIIVAAAAQTLPRERGFPTVAAPSTMRFGHTGVDVAAPDTRAEVLRADVAFPFILAAEGGGAAVAGEGAGKGPGVGGLDMLIEGGRGWVGLGAAVTRVFVIIILGMIHGRRGIP